MAQSENDKRDKRDRRKRARAVIAALLQRVQQICGPIARADKVAGQIADVVKQIKGFVEGTEAQELLSEKARKRLLDAVAEFEKAKGKIDTLAKACTRLQKALKYADIALSTTFPLGAVAAVAGAVVVGAVVAGAVILPNSMIINIENHGSDSIQVAGMFEFLPGVDFPGEIPPGEEGTVRVPRAFVGRFEVHTDEVVIQAFGRTSHVPLNNLDLQRSTWDGTALADLQGEVVSVGEGDTHSLVIFRR